MIFRKLRLKNIRSYTDGIIEFPNGSILLAGDVGAGKSTILHAIEFALFGALRSDLPAESLLRYGEDFGFVVLHIEIDGRNVVITRPLKRTNASIKQEAGSIVIDGVHHDLLPSEMRARILEIIGYPKDLMDKSKALIFRYTVYTPQDQMKKILGDDAEFRVNTLRRIFAIDRYQRAQSNAKIIVRDLRDEQKELSGYVMNLEERRKEAQAIRAKDEAITRRIAQIEHDEKTTHALLDAARHAAQKAKERAELMIKKQVEQKNFIGVLAAADARIMQMQETINSAKEQIREIEQKMDALEAPAVDIVAIEEEITVLEQRIVKKEQQRMQMQREIVLYHRQKEELTDVIKTAQKKHDVLLESLPPTNEPEVPSPALEELTMKCSDAQRKKEVLIADAAAYQHQIGHAAKLTEKIISFSECPTCLQPVTDEHKRSITGRHETAIAEARQRLEEIGHSRTDLDHTIEAIQALILKTQEKEIHRVRIQTARERIAELCVHIDQALSKREEVEEKIHALEESIEEEPDNSTAWREEIMCKKQMLDCIHKRRLIETSFLEKQEQLRRNEAGLAQEEASRKTVQDQLSRLTAELCGAQEVIKASDETAAHVETIDAKKRQIDLDLARWRTEKETTEDMLIIMHHEIIQKEHVKDRLWRIASLQQWIDEQFMNLMGMMERTMLLRVYHEFNDLFRSWFSMLVDDKTINAQLDADFTPHVVQNGYDAIFTNLSGGERAAICLAFRLALNKIINDIVSTIRTRDILLLDEPTDGFSDEQLDCMRDVLGALGLAQIIIVSHASKIESFVDHVIRIEKNDHQSEILA